MKTTLSFCETTLVEKSKGSFAEMWKVRSFFFLKLKKLYA